MDRIEETQRVKDPEHFDKMFLALMVRRMDQKRPDIDITEDFDAIQKVIDRLDDYVRTGNTIFLIEAGNYLWAEFAKPNHPAAHFKPNAIITR